MDNNQKVTVITVSYNLIENDREETFNDCLKSVHSQTHKNIEHIVIDGASTDGTIDLIKKYADKGWITYLSEPDRGVYDAMTKGVNLAKGEYIYFLNTDDKFFDDLVVEDVLKVFKKKNIYAVFGNLFPYLKNDNDPYLNVMTPGKVEKPTDMRFIHNLFKKNIHHQTIFYRKKVFETCSFCDEIIPEGSDWYLHIQAFIKNKYKAIYIDRIIAKFNLGGISTRLDEVIQRQDVELCRRIKEAAKIYKSPLLNYIELIQVDCQKIIKDIFFIISMVFKRLKSNLSFKLKQKQKRKSVPKAPEYD